MTSNFMKVLCRNTVRSRNSLCLILNRTASTQDIDSKCFTIRDVKKDLLRIMGLKGEYSPLKANRDFLLKYLPQGQDELPARSMQDSFREAYIPLETDDVLREKYVTFLGRLRVGRLMEDMDMFAVWVAKAHILNPKVEPGTPTPYVLVTVLVERITFTKVEQLSSANIRLSGHVSWVGRSSMEIVVWLEQFQNEKWMKLTRAIFLMAARNSNNTLSAPVNPLVPGSDYEKKILAGGAERNARRKKLHAQSLLKQVPDECEQQVIHNTFLETLDMSNPVFHSQKLPPNSVWMKEAKISNIIFCQPEDRNLHNKVFGGFLMRHAFELSWMEAYLFSKFRPRLLHISDITFIKPVDVGSLLKMQACVTYTEHNYAMILVMAEILDANGVPSTSNNFNYVYELPQEIKRVVPKSYAEAMLYVDGRRKFQHIMQLSGELTASASI